MTDRTETGPTLTRRLPALDREVSAVGLGCMGMSWAYSLPEDRDDRASLAFLAQALDAGQGFLDTSDAYGAGHNETLLGAALREWAGAEPVVATKGGLVGEFAGGAHVLRRDGRPEHLRAACEASLARLGVEQIDLYYLHRVDPEVPLAESWSALAELVDEGKVRALGLSEVTVAQAELAHAIHPVAAVQSELSLWTRDALGEGTTPDGEETGDMVAWTAAHEAVFVPFSPLGRGFLTGELDVATLKAGDFRAGNPRFAPTAAEANARIVDVVRSVAAAHGAHPAQIALAWVLAQGGHVIPIPGTTTLGHLRSNMAAAGIVLTPAELRALDGVPAAAGARY